MLSIQAMFVALNFNYDALLIRQFQSMAILKT